MNRGVVGRSAIWIPLGLAVMVGLYLTSYVSYLLFHSLAELFAVVVACSIFVIAWNTRQFMQNNYLLVVGVAYLFVGALDLLHTLAFGGMGVFQEYGVNLPTQLWIAARGTESVALAAAPLVLWRRSRRLASPWWPALAGLAVFTLVILTIFVWDVFPPMYDEQAGALTGTKVAAEWVICGILVVGGALLLVHRRQFDRDVLGLLLASIGLTVVGEMMFTLYTDPTGPANLAGHLLKVVSFYLIYKALIEGGLRRPYRMLFGDLQQSERDLREARDQLEVRVVERTRQLSQTVTLLRDEVAERKSAQAQLQAARDELETRVEERTAELARSNEELTQFAYVASHDLQEPLRMVTGYLQLIERRYRGRLDDAADEFIHYAVDGAARMQQLIADLLSYSRAGQGHEPSGSLDLQESLDWARANLQAAIEESGAQVTHDPMPWVIGDMGQLAQVFQNLLGNAIKFAGERPPRIHVSARRDGAHWAIDVRDEGIGIDMSHAGRVFQIFQRLHTQREYAGTGIGLAICKKIIERHGGRIWVDSAPGEGTTFIFSLPAATDGQGAALLPSAPADPAAATE